MKSLYILLALAGCSGSQDRVAQTKPLDLKEAEEPTEAGEAKGDEPPEPDRDAAIEASNRGVELFGAGKVEEALEAFRRAVALDPSWPEGHFNVGQVLSAMGDLEGARLAFTEAVRLAPGDANKRYRLGKTLVLLERHADGLSELDAAITAADGMGAAHEWRGRALVALGKDAEAAVALTRACELMPGKSRPHVSLTAVYSRWNERKAALAVLEVGLDRATDPDERAEFLHGLGFVLVGLGRHAEAVLALGQALAIKPDMHTARLERGQAYAALGDRRAARADLEAFIRSGSGTPFLRQAASQKLATMARGGGRRARIPSQLVLAAKKLPRVPALALPPVSGSTLTPLHLSVEKAKHLDTDVEVVGTIVWIYDCASAVRRPGESARARAACGRSPGEARRPPRPRRG